MVLKPIAGNCPVGNASMGHHVGEAYNFTKGEYFHGCVNYLFCEDRIGLLELSLFVLCSCVWKGSIRDKIHLELMVYL